MKSHRNLQGDIKQCHPLRSRKLQAAIVKKQKKQITENNKTILLSFNISMQMIRRKETSALRHRFRYICFPSNTKNVTSRHDWH